ncbi:histidinol-phosphatase HisJ [Clostridium sp. 1001271B_151109_B4]|uniref:histidinol-phosphatase HisJ n=1 Tax=Clostridium sp. 1001271B_151109_B4 TaxID=2787148 RepID=UPI0018A8E471|nr:histidinol-phosphatase HisJ [Clostridium sp. 1001271B_151109_B4]
MNNKRDGHVHSYYCPHGSNDRFEAYLRKAIELGIEEITFTEHMTMPEDLTLDGVDREYLNSSAPNIEEMKKYLKEVSNYKEEYKNKIKINIGLEVDYLEGYEEFTTAMLNEYGRYLDDALISIHIGMYEGKYYAFDCIESFEALLNKIGGVEKIYNLYYNTLLKGIKSNLGNYKPKRIGHPTLIRIFNKLYPIDYKNDKLFEEIIKEVKLRNYELDYNTAGLRKQYCGEIYPSGDLYDLAIKNNIQMVYGSDSHEAKDVGFNFK